MSLANSSPVASSSPQPASSAFEKLSPVTGESQGTFAITDASGVEAAIKRARAAFPAWRDLGIDGRIKVLNRLRPVLLENAESFARRISEDTGKPIQEALVTELISIWLYHDYNRKHAARVLGRRRVKTPLVFTGKQSYIEYFPRGVIGVISPWNYPLQLAVAPVLSALIGGNTVVLKPSEVTPLTGLLAEELFKRIGLPEGVVEVVHGDGSTGAALTAGDIDMVFFTGSVATGRKVMQAAAQKPIPCELELGGKDAFIVCADANLERAARAAVWGGLVNCGQTCISVERIFVVDSVHDRFVQLVREQVESLRVGGPDEFADVGPMIFARQISTVERHIADAKEKGARILTGGARVDRPGQFFNPTLLADVTTEMAIYREETFGPVLPVVRVQDEEEAIRLANDHEYGLNGSVWTQNLSKGMRLASRLECGQVAVNDVISTTGHPGLPFGGVKASGIGRYHGEEGLRAFMHTKGLMVDRGLLNNEPTWFPYTERKLPAVLSLARGVIGGSIPKLLSGFINLLRSDK